MNELKNPYAPGAGSPPPELAGRSEILRSARVSIERVQGGRQAKSFIFIGLRGVGKTVLLNEVQKIADGLGCVSLHIEAHDGKSLPELLVPGLRTLLMSLDRMAKATSQTRKALGVLRSFVSSVSVKVGEIDLSLGLPTELGTADSGDLEADLTALFLAVGEAAKSREKVAVVTIDELQYLSDAELSALIMAVHRLSQKTLPVLVVGAGLPQLVGQMGASKSYAERLFNFPNVGPLNSGDAKAALAQPAAKEGVEYSGPALDEIVRKTEGYPYFLQEWGYHAWNIAETTPITADDSFAAAAEAIRNLDASFFRVRFDRLTPRDEGLSSCDGRAGAGPTPVRRHRSGARRPGRKQRPTP